MDAELARDADAGVAGGMPEGSSAAPQAWGGGCAHNVSPVDAFLKYRFPLDRDTCAVQPAGGAVSAAVPTGLRGTERSGFS